ncbi:hypothetical protein AVEN_86310-1 [Araneus ventricosus]|uniref:Tc1-like transposase DDE domain-containing protein n=1 Tax=Araneus ventricosus TaxID=182803 RepID=A0A4Y2WRV5_ARAVE|nr:hypothetical protein AVEN_86310-1 [Araneus ventricosus]
MGKTADLSEFDRGQIAMARRLGTSITETARLGKPSVRRTFAPVLYSRSYTGWWWRYYALGDVLMSALGPVVVVEQTMKAGNYLNTIADQLNPYMAFVFPTGNRIFQQDNAPCHKTRIVLECFEEHIEELDLMP